MEDVVYTADNWLPGVLAETGMADGSVRSYGTWSGTHTKTGKKWEVKAYHTWDFKDGQIIILLKYFNLKNPTKIGRVCIRAKNSGNLFSHLYLFLVFFLF